MKLFIAGLLASASGIAFLAGGKVIGGAFGVMAVVLAVWGALDRKTATGQHG